TSSDAGASAGAGGTDLTSSAVVKRCGNLAMRAGGTDDARPGYRSRLPSEAARFRLSDDLDAISPRMTIHWFPPLSSLVLVIARHIRRAPRAGGDGFCRSVSRIVFGESKRLKGRN